MAIIVGIDGCPRGWLCVSMDTEAKGLESRIEPTFEFVAASFPLATVIAIDIPIGLPEKGPRECDLVARKLLGHRGSCVFPAPIRGAVRATSRLEASSIRYAIEGKKVSCQAFAIYAKIAEVDEVLNQNDRAKSITYEVHPEICFRELNARESLVDSKKTESGFATRKRLLEKTSLFPLGVYEQIRSRFTKSQVSNDDILDSLVSLWTAFRIYKGEASRIPEATTVDAVDLPMHMWC